jgi:DNA sulfur modification protein DndC
MAQQTLFESERLTLDRAIDITRETLQEYGKKYRNWQVSFSGGKDSTTLLTLMIRFIENGDIQPPENIIVMYADTRMELPSLHHCAMGVLERVARDYGISVMVVQPPVDKRFYVRMLGYGYPPPHNGFRWCTGLLKLDPMRDALWAILGKSSEKYLSLTGWRMGESVIRDQRIAMMCDAKTGECGHSAIVAEAQKHQPKGSDITYVFAPTTEKYPNDVLSPIVHWRVCHISDWLGLFAPDMGWDLTGLLDTYGWSGSGDNEPLEQRTGCYCCPVAGNGDPVLQRLVRMPRWAYLKPLLGLRSIYMELEKSKNRLRKSGERTKNGKLSKNPNRLGPLTFEARLWALEEIKSIQQAMGGAVSLITPEEERRIRELIAAGTYPDKWSADDHPPGWPIERVLSDIDGKTLTQPAMVLS